MPKLTLEQARASLAKAVEDRGEDWVYPAEWKMDWNDGDEGSCLYRHPDHPDRPACIVGYVLWDHGLLDQAPEGTAVAAESFETLLECDAQDYLSVAQTSQDTGASWGRARARAEAAVVPV